MNAASKSGPKRKFLSQTCPTPMKEFSMPHAANAGLVQRLPTLSKRSLLGASLLAMLCAALPQHEAHAQGPRNFATLAMVAEPQTLDPMASTADLVGTIMQHVYETLYIFDAKWNVV